MTVKRLESRLMPARRVSRTERPARQLWLHEESDSYVETFNDEDANRCAENGCIEVSGDRRHEANHYDSQRARLELALDEIAKHVEKRALKLAGERLMQHIREENDRPNRLRRIRKVR